jgi:hypothetical protein
MARVLVNGGRAFVTFLPRFSGVAGLFERSAEVPGQVTAENLRESLASGVFHNALPEGFQDGYFATVPYLRQLFADAGIVSQKVISLRGLAYGHEAAIWKMETTDPEAFSTAMDIVAMTASDPFIVSMAGPALFIGLKAAPIDF